MKSGQISVQSENIFPIIKKFLYSDQEIFLRELVSNAMDATTKVKTLAIKGDIDEELGDLTISVSVDKEAKTLTISDRGIGMTEDEMERYLNQMAFSSAQDFLEKYKDAEGIIGHFGLGFYSAFMVADRVEVVSRSYQSEDAVRWSCTGEPEYTIEPATRAERGTDIILHIDEDSVEYLEDSKIEELLNKYGKFYPVPLQFGMKTESTWEGEGDDKKEIKTEIPNIINDSDPIWIKSPAELKDEDYLAFYQKLYPFSQPPLFWIHMNIDFPFELTGILYFPKLTNQMEVQKNKIQLYSNQVFVTDDVSAIVPEFLTLLHGVIDSPDIPLNVSRSYLQSDKNVKKITSHITKKVADKLKDMFKTAREDYESKWDEISAFVKYGALTDEKFDERVRLCTLLKNIENKYFTLEEYNDLVKENQVGKDEQVTYIYSPDIVAQQSYVKAAQEYGYDVIQTDKVIDNHFIQHLEQKLEKVRFVRVDSNPVEKLIDKESTTESVLSEKELEKVRGLFELGLEQQKNGLTYEALSPDASPVMITRQEFMRRFEEMQMLQGNQMPEGMGDHYTTVVNTNHPLISDKLLKMRGEDKKVHFVQYLFDLARLEQGILSGEDRSAFIKRSLEFVA